MSLLDLASLVLAPTATKEGKVYSAIPNTGDGDMTFSRGSAATRVNSAGLIEKERANRLLQSNNFNTSPYSPAFATVTSGFEGYDGSNDGWKVASTTIGSETRIRQSQTFTTGEVITLSVYMKKGNVNFGIVRNYAITGGGRAWFDLENGTVATENSGINGSIEDVGNGWYRCSIWGVINTTGAVDIAPAPSDGDYLADAVGEFIYIQDSMLNEGLVAQSYIETTTTAVYEGITDDVPRVDYTGGGCPKLLFEPQRTNLVTFSEQIDNAAWNAVRATATANAATSPDGYQSADKLIPTSILQTHLFTQSFTTPSAGTYAYSAFFKKGEYDFGAVRITTDSDTKRFGAVVNLTNGEITATNSFGSPTNTSSKVEDYGNGWYRLIVTCQHTSGNISVASTLSPTAVPTFVVSLPQFTGDDTSGVFTWGAQLEAGSYATSYIPTYGSSVTRSADACSKTGISSLIGQTEGVIFVDFQLDQAPSDANGRLLQVWATNETTNSIIPLVNQSRQLQITTFNASLGTPVIPAGASTLLELGQNKIAVAYTSTSIVVYRNGVLFASGNPTGYFPTSLTSLDLGGSSFATRNLGNPISQALLFPTRLTNDELASLTTI